MKGVFALILLHLSPPVSAPALLPVSAPAPAATITPALLLQTDLVLAARVVPAPEYGDPPPGTDFRLRRARLGGEAVSGLWRARLVWEAYAPVTGRSPFEGGAGAAIAGSVTRVTDAYLAFHPGKPFQLAVGSLRVPFSLSRQIEEGDLRLPERPTIVHSATPDWRLGAALRGDTGLIQYAAGVFSGNARRDPLAAGLPAEPPTERGPLYVLRLAAEPIGPMGVAPWRRRSSDPWYGWWRFSAGGSVLYGQLAQPGTLGVSGDLQLQWRRLAIAAECLWTRQSWDQLGAYLEPGYHLWTDRLEVTVRLDWFRYDFPGAVATATTLGYVAGVTYSAYHGHVRLQAAYTGRRHQQGAERDYGWAVLRLTFAM
jgi:hypothetical protein